MTSVAPLFPPIVSYNSEVVLWDNLLTQRGLLYLLGLASATTGLEFRQMKWCSWSLGLPASSSLHQSNDSVASLHLWAALLPVTIKQRRDSLEIGCFPLKRMHLSRWQQWDERSPVISVSGPQHPWKPWAQDVPLQQQPPWGSVQQEHTKADPGSPGKMAVQGPVGF